jgi:hypothetical protein
MGILLLLMNSSLWIVINRCCPPSLFVAITRRSETTKLLITIRYLLFTNSTTSEELPSRGRGRAMINSILIFDEKRGLCYIIGRGKASEDVQRRKLGGPKGSIKASLRLCFPYSMLQVPTSRHNVF